MSLVNIIKDNPVEAATFIGGIVTYLWNKARGKKTDDLWDTMEKLGKQVLPRLLEDSRLTDDRWVLEQIKDGIYAGLERIGVKRSKTIDILVTEVAEHVKADFADMIIKKLLAGYIKTSEQTVGTLKEANAS